jgi:hypothetical protein
MTSITPVSGKWETKRTITVDNRTSELIVTLAFNDKNGQYKISSHITTIQVSRNDEMQRAVLQQQAEMQMEAMAYAIELRDQWATNNPEREDADYPEIPFPEPVEADNDEHEPQLSLTAPKKGKKPTGKKAAEVTEGDFSDDENDTLSDGLSM